MRRVHEALESLGYEIDEVELPRFDEALDLYGRFILTEFRASWPMLSKLLPPDGRKYLELFMEVREPGTLEEYIGFAAKQYGLRREYAEFMERYPLIVGPVFTEDPVAPDYDAKGAKEFAFVQHAMRLNSATSLLGLPSVSIPVGVDGGFPQSVQFIGRPFYEADSLAIAEQVEKIVGTLTPIDPR